MSEPTRHYDVIIIGTGAGGGTLAYALAPSGKRILLLERGDYVRREKENWSSRGRQPRGALQHQGSVARQGREAAPPPHQLLCRRQHQVLWRGAVPPAQGGLRRAAPPRRHLARLADQRTTSSSRTTPRRSASMPGPRRTRGGPDRPSGQRAVPVPRRQSRATHSATARRSDSSWGYQPFHVPLGVMLDERDPTEQRLHPLRHLRRVPLPGSRASPTRKYACVDPALQHPNVTLMTNAYVTRLETSASGREVTGVAVERPARRDATPADIVVVVVRRHQLGGAAAAFGERQPSATASPTLGRRRAPLHGAHQFRPDGDFEAARIRPCSRRRSAINDFYFGTQDWPTIRWGTSRSSASSTLSRSARRGARRSRRA